MKSTQLLVRVLLAALLTAFVFAPTASGQVDTDKLKAMKVRAIGPAGMSGRVTTIDVNLRDPDVIYFGTASGGLWKSTDGGISSKPIFDDQPVHSIGAVAVDQTNPQIIWAGAGEGNPRNSQNAGDGVFKSMDGGRTWTQLPGFEDSRNIHRLIIHPDNGNVVYVGVQGSQWGDQDGRGVWKTTDAGETWSHILEGDKSVGIADLVMDPSNPDKLIAAMWEFRRTPHDFNSGGPGSGMFMTYDGGATWTRLTKDDGLPEGNLGRIGLGIAPSNPKVVYALVEAKKNALYRSSDGGHKWVMVNNEDNVNPRPFYYGDIRVDPKNENRIYSLHSRLGMSTDGGKSFQTIANNIHPDHHAMWIHPDDPTYLIEGNDGGAAISRNHGETWRFVENLPLAQFYHINVDMQTPYNVCGGMQDNGSWCGPSDFWGAGGIRNEYWTEVGFGDGFDVVPDRQDNRFGYGMSQGGNLYRYDALTGANQGIRPHGPDSVDLRFNWNAAIAMDPHDNKTIYYGSQFVHRSPDKGASWEIISPDLTTNDPEKQKQIDSGGLTYDVTNAENNTTIVAIGPSPLDKNVIWVGSDDGKIHVTRDGGANWSDVSELPGVPEGYWVAQIQPSLHAEGEAFAVIDDHRRNNWEPYIMKTTDYGRSWTNLVSADAVSGFALSLAQDPVTPNLLFAGTEFGLYFSIDAGSSWTQWKNGYPTTPTIDLVIHPREHDLVIGTFGRSAFILDDIRPLRALAADGAELLDATVSVFDAPTGIQAQRRQAAGKRFPGEEVFMGETKESGAMISYIVNMPEGGPGQGGRGRRGGRAAGNPADQVGGEAAGRVGAGGPPGGGAGMGRFANLTEEEREERFARMRQRMGPRAEAMIARLKGETPEIDIEILDVAGEVIRTMKGPAENGLNRVMWDMRKQGMESEDEGSGGRGGGGGFFNRTPPGPQVLPGEYTIRIKVGDEESTGTVTVEPDPRIPFDEAGAIARAEFAARANQDMQVARKATRELNQAKENISSITARLRSKREEEGVSEVLDMGRDLNSTIESITEMFSGKQGLQGIRRDPKTINSGFFRFGFRGGSGAPTQSELVSIAQAEARLEAGLAKVNDFFEGDYKTFQDAVEKVDLPLFEAFETLTLPETADPGNIKGQK